MSYICFMGNTMAKAARSETDIASLLNRLAEQKRRLDGLFGEVERVLRSTAAGPQPRRASQQMHPARSSPLDQINGVLAATTDLRLANGKLSAERLAKVFGVSLSRLAGWLGKTKQAVSKTPDADSLQTALGYFERVARLRLVIGGDAQFRKWLRTSHELLGDRSPLELLARGEWQVMADYVEDALTGAST